MFAVQDVLWKQSHRKMTNRTYLRGNGRNNLTKTGYGMRVVECLDLYAKMNGFGAIITTKYYTPWSCKNLQSNRVSEVDLNNRICVNVVCLVLYSEEHSHADLTHNG